MGVILVSTCLTGLPARYNGARRINAELAEMLEGLNWVPVCPEQLGGLATPRPPSSLVGGNGHDVLDFQARVTDPDGIDLSEAYRQGAGAIVELAARLRPEAIFLQARSPSCGSVVRSGSDGGPRPVGVAAAALARAGWPVIEVWEAGLSEKARNKLAELRHRAGL